MKKLIYGKLKNVHWKYFTLMLIPLGGICTIASASCSFHMPKMRIDGEGGAYYKDHQYIYSIALNWMYDTNLQIDNFNVSYYGNKAGDIDYNQPLNYQSGPTKYFETFKESGNTQTEIINHKFWITSTNISDDIGLPPDDFFMVINYKHFGKNLAQSIQPISNNLISIGMNENSNPSDYCNEQLNDGNYDAWSVLPNYTTNDPNVHVKIASRLKADIVYEMQDLQTAIPRKYPDLQLKVNGMSAKVDFFYDYTINEINNFHLHADVDVSGKIGGFLPMETIIHLDITTEGAYYLNGSFTVNSAMSGASGFTGNYLSFMPKGTTYQENGTTKPVRFHQHFESERYSSYIPTIDRYEYTMGQSLLGSSSDEYSFYIKSYYLDKVKSIAPVMITGWNNDWNQASHWGNTDIPKIDQSSCPVDYQNTSTFFANMGLYFSQQDSAPIEWPMQADLDRNTFVWSEDGSDCYEVTCQSPNGLEKKIPFQELTTTIHASNTIHNSEIQYWNDGCVYIQFFINYCYIQKGNPGSTPEARPGDTKSYWPANPYIYALPPDSIPFESYN